MESAYHFSVEEINYFAVASLVLGAGFTAWKGILTVDTAAFYVAAGAVVLLVWELGERTVAEWMEGYVDLNISLEGSFFTVFVAAASVLTEIPLIVLLPVWNSYSNREYEQWGKSTETMWAKRQYWIVSGGVAALLLGWAASYQLGVQEFAEAFILFTFFQLLPFDHSSIPAGTLPGAKILRWSGLWWMLWMGITLLAMVLTL